MNSDQPTVSAAQLPLYQCHKQVRAMKIGEVSDLPNPDTSGRSAAASYGATLVPDDLTITAVSVSGEWVCKHRPQAGGYYVLYADGYASYSPAEAFEGGYRPVDGRTALQVTPDMITAAIVSSDFHVLPGTQITVCVITLRNGAKVLGYNYGAIDPMRQDWQQGRQAAYDMAREKVWELEGYALRERFSGA